jgi:hypothetical protein
MVTTLIPIPIVIMVLGRGVRVTGATADGVITVPGVRVTGVMADGVTMVLGVRVTGATEGIADSIFFGQLQCKMTKSP